MKERTKPNEIEPFLSLRALYARFSLLEIRQPSIFAGFPHFPKASVCFLQQP